MVLSALLSKTAFPILLQNNMEHGYELCWDFPFSSMSFCRLLGPSNLILGIQGKEGEALFCLLFAIFIEARPGFRST
jgi:hypothetical protein